MPTRQRLQVYAVAWPETLSRRSVGVAPHSRQARVGLLPLDSNSLSCALISISSFGLAARAPVAHCLSETLCDSGLGRSIQGSAAVWALPPLGLANKHALSSTCGA